MSDVDVEAYGAERAAFFQSLTQLMGGGQGKLPDLTAKPTLKKGDKGDDVILAQNLLQQILTLNLSAELGTFGDMTRSAVVQFQSKQGLRTTGEIDKPTWTALDSIQRSKRFQQQLQSIAQTVQSVRSGGVQDVPAYEPTEPTPASSSRWVPYAVGAAVVVTAVLTVAYVTSRPAR
jgi:peptidoglycan hydrolase-like protein with peptidoglycan-binding domain